MRELAPRLAQQQALGQVLELGTGSGVVLATLLALGARHAMGVDLEAQAVDTTRALLAQQGLTERASVLQGDLWAPCRGLTFDLIVTNLPQFPLLAPLPDGRLPLAELEQWRC